MNNIVFVYYQDGNRENIEFDNVKQMKEHLKNYDIKYGHYYRYIGEYIATKEAKDVEGIFI